MSRILKTVNPFDIEKETQQDRMLDKIHMNLKDIQSNAKNINSEVSLHNE